MHRPLCLTPSSRLFRLPRISMLYVNGLICACLCLLTLISTSAQANPRYASIIVEERSGKVLYSRNADKLLYPASLTKIMTLYMVFEELQRGTLSLSTRMSVSRVAASRSPSKLYLQSGSTISVENAILALVTKSANDVATVISEHLSGTEREFAKRMTRKARALGMHKTTFKNASGLPNRAQKSTAREMARLGIAIRRDFPQYYHYFKTKSFRYNGRAYRNHNKLLSKYTGTDGIKTGFTNASGFNLVASVERSGVRLVGVIFGGRTGTTRDKHLMSLFARQFGRLPELRLAALPKVMPTSRPALPHNDVPATTSLASDDSLWDEQQPQERGLPSEWMVQVGSFSRRVNAHKAAILARRHAGQALDLVPAHVSLVMRGNMPLWRVRFGGLNEDQARAACAELFATGNACFALPGETAQQS